MKVSQNILIAQYPQQDREISLNHQVSVSPAATQAQLDRQCHNSSLSVFPPKNLERSVRWVPQGSKNASSRRVCWLCDDSYREGARQGKTRESGLPVSLPTLSRLEYYSRINEDAIAAVMTTSISRIDVERQERPTDRPTRRRERETLFHPVSNRAEMR